MSTVSFDHDGENKSLIKWIIIHENILSSLYILSTEWNENEKQLLKTYLGVVVYKSSAVHPTSVKTRCYH